MAHAVFIQNPKSIYADRPGELYHFPAQYLRQVAETVGDWVVFYESRKGAYGYTSVQKVVNVMPDDSLAGHHFAVLDQQSLLDFEQVVPRLNGAGTTFESILRGADGKPYRGGANTLAVRRLVPQDFAAIVDCGLEPVEDVSGMVRLPSGDGASAKEGLHFRDAAVPFEHKSEGTDRRRVLASRAFRDASFARQVKRAYGNRCAMSGLALTNGGGRPEVEAAHIKPVAHAGPDTVRNGIALSGTLHWMFDRGLLGIAPDDTILVSANKVPRDVVERLINPAQKLILPTDKRLRPHPEYLQYHREQIFGQSDIEMLN